MNRPICILLLILLCSCQAKETSVQSGAMSGDSPSPGSIGYEDGSQYPSSTPTTTPVDPIFSQTFEVDDDVFLNFQNCKYNTKCNIQIEYRPDVPIKNLCTYGNTSSVCQDDLRNVSCAAQAKIYANGTMEVFNSYGVDDAKTAFCDDYDGLYTYIVTTCRTDLVQKIWKCGEGSQIYDLYWFK